MKKTLALALSFLSFSSFAYVDSKNCPETFSAALNNITRVALSTQIENSYSAKLAWSSLKDEKEIVQDFTIVGRLSTAICIYVSDVGGVATLQTNDGVDELNITIGKNINVYSTAKVLSFSPDHLTIANDAHSKNIYAENYSSNPDSTESLGQVKVGSLESIEVK